MKTLEVNPDGYRESAPINFAEGLKGDPIYFYNFNKAHSLFRLGTLPNTSPVPSPTTTKSDGLYPYPPAELNNPGSIENVMFFSRTV
jgi:hypothetical protein